MIRGGGTIPVKVIAFRSDGFAGDIDIAPLGDSLKAPAGTTETHVSAATLVLDPDRSAGGPAPVAANQTRSDDTRTDPTTQTFVGKIDATATGFVPSRWTMIPVRTTITPSEATALATADARRSGRNVDT